MGLPAGMEMPERERESVLLFLPSAMFVVVLMESLWSSDGRAWMRLRR